MIKTLRIVIPCLAVLVVVGLGHSARAADVEIASVRELAEYAGKSGNTVRMKPGLYRMSDYLTGDVIAAIRKEVPATSKSRVPVWMIRFSGNDNRFDLKDVVLEIDTTLYPKLPHGYTRCLFVPGKGNVIDGLSVRNTGPNQGSGGNTCSVWGTGNRVENVTLYVSGSKPYGYGDLLGKGGPNLVGLQKQSGFMVAGRDNTLRRCKVISRAFGHCYYVQNRDELSAPTENILIEDCYAEGVVRPTSEMLRETDGPLAQLNFRTVAENRDGRFLVVPGYVKSLSEDGFRTYGGTGKVTLRNCTAVNTRAGFEIAGPDQGKEKTLIEGGNALGCERAYLIGSNTVVRNSRGDTRYGPLLYLRGGRDSDVELELAGEGSDYTVHALATIAGENHRVRLFTRESRVAPSVPILLGFGMPSNAEMASPFRSAPAKGVHLINELPRFPVIRGAEAADCVVETQGPLWSDDEARRLPTRPTSAPVERAVK